MRMERFAVALCSSLKSEISSGEDVQAGYFNLPSSNDSGFKD